MICFSDIENIIVYTIFVSSHEMMSKFLYTTFGESYNLTCDKRLHQQSPQQQQQQQSRD